MCADLLEDAKELGIELDFRVIDTDYANIQVGDVLRQILMVNGKWQPRQMVIQLL